VTAFTPPQTGWRALSLALSVALSVALVACRSERPAATPEAPATVLSYSSPMWYEETGRYFQVSPDARLAIYGTGARSRLFDVRSGAFDSVAWRRGLGQVRGGTFGASGEVVRSGIAGKDTSWFVEVQGSLTPIPIPVNALPRWGPDNSSIVFFVPGDSSLTLSAKGAAKTLKLDGAVNGVNWAPSGDALYAIVLHPDGLSSLEKISVDGTVSTVRPHLDASPFFNSVAVSPDGNTLYLALASDTIPDPKTRHDPEAPHRDLDIYALDLRSSQLRTVVHSPDDDCCPVIAGGFLYWTHNSPGAEIVVFPLGGGRPKPVAEHGFLPRWSPDGRQIAFTRGYYRLSDYGLDMDGWVVGVDSAGGVTSPPKPWITGYGEDMGPVWSPDGHWVAFHSHRSATPVPLYESPGRTDDIWLELTAGGPEIRLTDFGYEVGPPVWAPDGRHLLFDSWERNGPPRFAKPWIITIDPATGKSLGAVRMPLPAGVAGIDDEAWSPKRNEIALVQRIDDVHRALWLTPPDGSGAHKLTDFQSYTIGGVAFTPDGDQLLYGALAGDRMQVFEIPRTGGAPRQVTHEEVNVMHPSVSPDGRLIAASRIPWRKELRRIPLP